MGSGSRGNSLLIAAKDGVTNTTVMVDCGFSIRETERRLARAGCRFSDLSAIVVTHEHSDHAGGVVALARRHHIPVWMSYGTFQSLKKDFSGIDLNFCRDGDRFSIGNLQLSAFTVSHDAQEPLQFHVTDGAVKFGLLTDTGQITSRVSSALASCDVLMIECNYDEAMLEKSFYPYYLKKRISSTFGHLSNERAADFLSGLDTTRLKKVVCAHLSQNNNLPKLAKEAIASAVNTARTEVLVAGQKDGFDWLEVS